MLGCDPPSIAMAVHKLLLVLSLSVSGILGQVNISDYIFWKKADMLAWHEFFPSRVMEEERLTGLAATGAVPAMASGLNDSLTKVVSFQAEELSTAMDLMAGTPAEGCVNGIADYVINAIYSAIDSYDDCAADAPAKLARLNVTWTRRYSAYQAAYTRALSGVDACWYTYPNRDQIDRLRSCVDSMINNYHALATSAQAAMVPSPSMGYMQDVVMKCARNAVIQVAAQGKQFLAMLVECAALSGTVDPAEYQERLSQWKGYKDDLGIQLADAQSRNYARVSGVESLMRSYYEGQKTTIEQSLIESRGLGYYQSKVYTVMSDFYNTLTTTSLDNPGDEACVSAARASLDGYALNTANASLSCDLQMVNRTKQLIADISSEFRFLNQRMTAIGNVALLDCLSLGYMYAPLTISACFNLTYTGFDLDLSDRYTKINNDTSTLYDFQAVFAGADLPCGASSLDRLMLAGQTVLYELQRCLYTKFGTDYTVTTPLPLTTPTAEPSFETTTGVPS